MSWWYAKIKRISMIGGMLITITRLFSDIRFISKIKQEYIESKINSQFEKELKELGISL